MVMVGLAKEEMSVAVGWAMATTVVGYFGTFE
jgi:hypothetical protein